MGALDRIFRRRASSQQTIEAQVQNIIRAAAAAHQCVWYDPSDLSTMFQDSAGTTPVTAVEQSVGLILDKSKGLALGPELVANGSFDSAGSWTFSNTGTGSAAISGGRLGLTGTDASNRGRAYQVVTCEVGKTYKFSSSASGAASSVGIGLGIGQTGLAACNGGQSCVFTATATSVYVTLYNTSAGGTAYLDNISVRELPGNHASQATTGYKPVLKQDANGRYHLKFDGSDDFLVTSSIDFSTTDKVAVAAGVRKLSDAATGAVVEFSPAYTLNNGAFALLAPSTNASTDITFVSKGTSAVFPYYSPGVAPQTRVVAGMAKISAPSAIIRLDGVQRNSSAASQGTGNYGNYPLYIGRRGGTSIPFSGHLYGLCVIGGLDDITKLRKIERLLAKKTGVTV